MIAHDVNFARQLRTDKQSADGGFAERAASAGAFSDERVLTAMDLYAAAFSDRSETAKTKDMKAEVARLRSVVSTWRQLASKGKMSGADLSKIKALYKEGGDAYNRYAFKANEGLNIKMKRLDYL